MRRANGEIPLCGFGEIVARAHELLPVLSTIVSIAENENGNYHLTPPVFVTPKVAYRTQHVGRNSDSVLRRKAIELAEYASAIPPYKFWSTTG